MTAAQAFVTWSPSADDGGGPVTKYKITAATAYTDVKVDSFTSVPVPAPTDNDSADFVTEATVTGLTNGFVYSFQVVAENHFGYSPTSLPSNKVGSGDAMCCSLYCAVLCCVALF